MIAVNPSQGLSELRGRWTSFLLPRSAGCFLVQTSASRLTTTLLHFMEKEHNAQWMLSPRGLPQDARHLGGCFLHVQGSHSISKRPLPEGAWGSLHFHGGSYSGGSPRQAGGWGVMRPGKHNGQAHSLNQLCVALTKLFFPQTWFSGLNRATAVSSYRTELWLGKAF